MTRRAAQWLAGVGLALTLVALAYGVTVQLVGPSPGVTEANLRRLRPGMTEAEVEALLGRPADEVLGLPSELALRERPVVKCWYAPERTAMVRFARDNRVEGVSCIANPAPGPAEPEGAGPFTRLRALFGW